MKVETNQGDERCFEMDPAKNEVGVRKPHPDADPNALPAQPWLTEKQHASDVVKFDAVRDAHEEINAKNEPE